MLVVWRQKVEMGGTRGRGDLEVWRQTEGIVGGLVVRRGQWPYLVGQVVDLPQHAALGCFHRLRTEESETLRE